jgi:hypothetical protein
MKKIVLTEEQVKRIFDKIISEQTTPTKNNEPFTVDFGDYFESGQYSGSTTGQTIFKKKVTEIVNYVKDKQIKNFKILITAGESQVPNPSGFEEKGSLANKRAQILKDYIAPILQNSLGMTPVIEIAPYVLGNTPWDRNLGKNYQKYKNEQFVKATIVLTAQKTPTPTPTPTTGKIIYDRYARLGEVVRLGYDLIGYANYDFVKTKDIKDSGILDTSSQNIIFTEVKKDTVPTQVLGQYEIPYEWWNTRAGAETNVITPDQLVKIRTFKKIYSPNYGVR